MEIAKEEVHELKNTADHLKAVNTSLEGNSM